MLGLPGLGQGWRAVVDATDMTGKTNAAAIVGRLR
jgi:hypothetical protein